MVRSEWTQYYLREEKIIVGRFEIYVIGRESSEFFIKSTGYDIQFTIMEGLKKFYELLWIIFRTGQISMDFYWCESLGYQGEKENNLSKSLHKKQQEGTFGGDG